MALPLVTNLGSRGRRRRYLMGAAGLALTLLLAAGLVLIGAPRGARLVLFLPVFVAALGFFQARGGTGTGLASRGLRETATGTEPVSDAWAAGELNRQAREIFAQAVLVALALTAVGLLLPAPAS